MSADNAIYYRQIGDEWFVMEGCASCDYSDDDYRRRAEAFTTKDEALHYADVLADDCIILVYGIYHDPSPPLPPIDQLQSRLKSLESIAWGMYRAVTEDEFHAAHLKFHLYAVKHGVCE